MRSFFFFVLFSLAESVGLCQDLSVLAVHRCESRIIVETKLTNTSRSVSIETPLSQEYEYGHALGSATLQYQVAAQRWVNIQRGTDQHPAGSRYLEPGEAIDDVIVADISPDIESKVAGLKLRVALTLAPKGSGKYRLLYSQPFTVDEKTLPDASAWFKKSVTEMCSGSGNL